MKLTTFDDFIFNNQLKAELENFVNNPDRIPSPICFYGEPGTGKTTFAKFLAEEVASEVSYIDATDQEGLKKHYGSLANAIKSIGRTKSLFVEDKHWSHAVIVDEFSNLRANDQNSLKVPLEQYSANANVLFIFCTNLDKNQTIAEILSPAIFSRTHNVSFNMKQHQLAEASKAIKQKFPQLSEFQIKNALPDMRIIQRIAKLAA